MQFKPTQSLHDFQTLIDDIYGLPDDRLYSLDNILTQQQRFTMRALKGVRKDDVAKTRVNLLIALSWSMAVANRLHIDMQDMIWQRFPNLCSYCGHKPCICKATKPKNRPVLKIGSQPKDFSLANIQTMFEEIYPSADRTIDEAGVHLAEEMGEVTEAVHNFLGQHQRKQFDEITDEMADYVSCVFGLANSAGIDVAKELAKMYKQNCHVCHKAPCECSFSSVARLNS